MRVGVRAGVRVAVRAGVRVRVRVGVRVKGVRVRVRVGAARGALEVHHVVDRREVEAARGDVGGEKDAVRLGDEAVDGLEASTLLHVTLQRDDVDLHPIEQRAQPAGGGRRWRQVAAAGGGGRWRRQAAAAGGGGRWALQRIEGVQHAKGGCS